METYKKKTNSGDDVFVRIQAPSAQSASSPPPTAVLLGWLGAQHRHLDKYTQLYSDMGYNTVQTVAPHSVVFPIHPRFTAAFLLSVLRILASDDRLTSGGIVMHMFSNGGAVNAPHLSIMFSGNYRDFIKADDEIVVKKVKDSIAAVLFDSSPVYLHADKGVRSIADSLGLSIFVSRIIFALFVIVFTLQRIFIINLPKFFWETIRSADYLCPEQYIYSRQDHLIDIPKLEALILERKRAGRSVRTLVVDDAEHVLILRKYPDKYQDTIHAMNDWGINAWRHKASLDPWEIGSAE